MKILWEETQQVKDPYAAVRKARRRLENRIRVDCSDMEYNEIPPREIINVLQGVLDFWREKIQNIGK